jgi:hypothetical protein
MGYNTSVLILNDALGSLREDKDFGDRLASAISGLSVNREKDVRIGNHVNGCRVIETHHADNLVPILVGGNMGYVIEGTYINWSSGSMELDLLHELAIKHGFRLSKKPKK